MMHNVAALSLATLAFAPAALAGGPIGVADFAPRALSTEVRHAVLNLHTGDRVVLPAPTRQGTELVYGNDGANCTALAWLPLVSNAVYDPATGLDGEITSYGDIPAGTEFNCFTWGYVAAGIFDSGSGALGFDGFATFYNNDNSSTLDGPDVDVDPAAGFFLTDIFGDTSGMSTGWLLTVDVSAGGTQRFSMGDLDEDRDGLADIGWGYSFCGPAITPGVDFGPINAVPGNADARFPGDGRPLPASQGVEDNAIVFWSTFCSSGEPRGGQDIDGLYTNFRFAGNYGGWSSSCGTGIPHISLFIQLLNDTGSQCPPCIANFDDSVDTTPNSSDFLAFLNAYSQQDPCADLAPPGGDGTFDSSDFLAYLNAYALGC